MNYEKIKQKLESAIYEGADDKFYIGGMVVESIVKQLRLEILREVYEAITDYENTDLAIYALHTKVPDFAEAAKLNKEKEGK